MIISLATAVVLSVLLFYFTLPLASFISTDPLMLDNISEYKNWCISLILLGVFAYILDGIFLAAAAGRGLRNGMIFAFAIYAITLVSASSIYGNHGLWFALNILMLGRVAGLWHQFAEIKAKFD
jgi:Na+-driven multidrug efflux pump